MEMKKKDYVCNFCKDKWTSYDLDVARWGGFLFKFSECTGQLICPECYSDMRAAFISAPPMFKAWISENFTA